MVGFVHFSNFLIPSEKYYKLQSCWITLYQSLRINPHQKQQDQVTISSDACCSFLGKNELLASDKSTDRKLPQDEN